MQKWKLHRAARNHFSGPHRRRPELLDAPESPAFAAL